MRCKGVVDICSTKAVNVCCHTLHYLQTTEGLLGPLKRAEEVIASLARKIACIIQQRVYKAFIPPEIELSASQQGKHDVCAKMQVPALTGKLIKSTKQSGAHLSAMICKQMV